MVGPGAVGSRAARHLAARGYDVEVVGRTGRLDPAGLAVAVLTAPGPHRSAAEAALEAGVAVVSTSDDLAVVRSLLDLDAEARVRGVAVVVGAAMSPGLSCVLARAAAARLDRVTQVHVFSVGTGGPACARRHHHALTSAALDWDGTWVRRPGGSGRELVWFPEPVGAADCYRAELVDPMLLVTAFPGVERVTARLEATRRDRLTSWLPMLRRPHPEGLVGAVRVELRGFAGTGADTVVWGAGAPPAVCAAAVAATGADWAASGRLAGPGAGGLATMVGLPGAPPGAFLAELAPLGVAVSEFAGA